MKSVTQIRYIKIGIFSSFHHFSFLVIYTIWSKITFYSHWIAYQGIKKNLKNFLKIYLFFKILIFSNTILFLKVNIYLWVTIPGFMLKYEKRFFPIQFFINIPDFERKYGKINIHWLELLTRSAFTLFLCLIMNFISVK